MSSDYADRWIWMITGPNGAGKSSCRNSLPLPFPKLPSVNLDWTAKYLALSRGVYAPTKEQAENFHEEAGHLNNLKIREYFNAGQSFTVERVAAELPLPEEILRRYGWKVGAVIFALATPELSRERVNRRVHEGGHPVGLVEQGSSLKEMWEISAFCASRFLKVCDEALIFDNSGNAPALAAFKKTRHAALALTPEGQQLLSHNRYLEEVFSRENGSLSLAG